MKRNSSGEQKKGFDCKEMNSCIIEGLDRLKQEGKLDKEIVLWGVGSQTQEILNWFDQNMSIKRIIAIADNFKYTFWKQYQNIPVIQANELRELDQSSFIVLFAVLYSEAVKRQLEAYGVREIYNLRNLSEETLTQSCKLPYHFINRSRGKKFLCYILAGYEPVLWENTLARIKAFQSEVVDYCLVSSGKYDKALDELAEKNQWSYLYTMENQVCFIQNQVIACHPQAEYMIKMDEDIFIGKHFFQQMIQEFLRIEKEGDYRIGFAVPVIPLNCSGYVPYLKAIGMKEEFERQFGRAYKSRFSAIQSVDKTAEFLWDTMDSFDEMAGRFLQRDGFSVCDCYFNIGCIMYTRKRWLMMGKWPEKAGESGMGMDEAYIYQDNVEKDLSVYEIHSVLAGHLAFGHQKQQMIEYFQNNREKFAIRK